MEIIRIKESPWMSPLIFNTAIKNKNFPKTHKANKPKNPTNQSLIPPNKKAGTNSQKCSKTY